MRVKLLFLIIFISYVASFGQEYPEVTIRDVQFVEADSLNYYGSLGLEAPQPLNGDTVTVAGVVMFPPFMGANPDSTATISVAVPGIILQDTEEAEWGGVIVRDVTSSADFAILEEGLIIKATAVVAPYYSTTQINLIKFEASDIIGQMTIPEAVPLTLDSFYVSTPNSPNFLAEKWENVFVEFTDVTVVETEVLGPGTFSFQDADGFIMNTYDRANYYRSGYTSPLPGTTIKRIRGFIETWETGTTWFMLNPVGPDDIEFGEVTPPVIDNEERSVAFAGYGEDVTITADVNDADGSSAVAAVKLFYSVNGADYTEMDMTLVDEEAGSYEAVIPGQSDSSLVSYYIQAADMANTISYSPGAAADDPYYYYVLDRPLTIKDIQYQPEDYSFTSLNGFDVTVTGIVTTDTSDMPGGVYYDAFVHMQDENGGPWSGLQIFGTEAELLTRGDKVTVTGRVNDNFGYTRLGTIDQGVSVTLIESGAAPPDPVVISTEVAASTYLCESYEGVVVKVQNVTVEDENVDGDPGPAGNNYGEISVADASGVPINVLLDCGGNEFHNFWDVSQEGQPIQITTGDTFTELMGIMFYSYSEFKLNPRKNDDFVGHIVVGVKDITPLAPDNYELAQNYPNPFNPTTKIQFSMPESGHIKLNVFNVLGQQITSLVDGFRDAGVHIVDFDASSLTSGIYFYEMSVNNFRTLNKMILVK